MEGTTDAGCSIAHEEGAGASGDETIEAKDALLKKREELEHRKVHLQEQLTTLRTSDPDKKSPRTSFCSCSSSSFFLSIFRILSYSEQILKENRHEMVSRKADQTLRVTKS